jgi:hypothetical protein
MLGVEVQRTTSLRFDDGSPARDASIIAPYRLLSWSTPQAGVVLRGRHDLRSLSPRLRERAVSV